MGDNSSTMNTTEEMMELPTALTYVSFAEPDRCLGVVILEGELNVGQAALACHTRGINPGGEVMAMSCTSGDDDVPAHIYAAMAASTNKLISAAEARELFEGKSLKELDEENEEDGKSPSTVKLSSLGLGDKFEFIRDTVVGEWEVVDLHDKGDHRCQRVGSVSQNKPFRGDINVTVTSRAGS